MTTFLRDLECNRYLKPKKTLFFVLFVKRSVEKWLNKIKLFEVCLRFLRRFEKKINCFWRRRDRDVKCALKVDGNGKSK